MDLLKRQVYITLLVCWIQLTDAVNEVIYSCTFDESKECGLFYHAMTVSWNIKDESVLLARQGPAADHTWGTDYGKYVFSASKTNLIASTFAPKLTTGNLTLPNGEGVLSFYHFSWGAPGNVLNVDINCGDNMDRIWTSGPSGPVMSSWVRTEKTVKCSGPFKVIFEGVHSANHSNIALDDILLYGNRKESSTIVSKLTTPVTIDSVPFGGGGPDMNREKPPQMTMPTDGVHNQPTGTMMLAIIIFTVTFVLFVVSVTIHCVIWRRRAKRNVKLRKRPVSLLNSAYNCPIHAKPDAKPTTNGTKRKAPVRYLSDEERTVGFEKSDAGRQSPRSSESGVVVDSHWLANKIPFLNRGRSKTVPNKRSFECYETIEMTGDGGDDQEKRVLSDKGGRMKQGFLGRHSNFSRSNSLPTSGSPRNDFYESIDQGRALHGPFAYEVTDLMSGTCSVIDGSTSSISSIPSMNIALLKPSSTYDNLERKSPLLPPRHSPGIVNYTSPSIHSIGSNYNIASLYSTAAPPSQGSDGVSLSSYDMLSMHADMSRDDTPTTNHQSNPFFQAVNPSGEHYSSLNRCPSNHTVKPTPERVSNVPLPTTPDQSDYQTPIKSPAAKPQDAGLYPTPTTPDQSDYQTPIKSPAAKPQDAGLYHTLDPDAVSDASFERSMSEEARTNYETPQLLNVKNIRKESSHDYEDLD
ncbi:uncharacterized protein [Asterias amurensis]|uniref:uncharacterized protein n=1 Tax=Asterias amurensis TaxID=7602 RepID=UPI003AB4A7A1